MTDVDTSAIQAAAAATTATYRSFADATRSVLDLLERHFPEAVLFLAHLDRGQFIHRIVDARNGAGVGLRSNLAIPLGDAFCSHMAEDRAPRVCNDVGRDPVYAGLPMQERVGARAYLGVPLELSDGTRVGSLAALRHSRTPFSEADEQLFLMLARVLASELERESNERDLRRFNDLLRDQARGMGAIGRVARALAGTDDARTAVCEAACEVSGAPVAFLLEPSGRDFVSTAMAGVQIAPVTIQPRGEPASGGGRAFTSKETYFVADARTHPALATPLAVAIVDLDHMGAFNMLRGEREGDRLIKETAALWRGQLREVDLLARLEGTEFGVLLPGCGLAEAVRVLHPVPAA